MRARSLIGVALLMVGLGSGTLAAGDAGRRPTRQCAIVYIAEPTLIGSTIVQGPVLFTHDAAKMARGEPCTTVRLFEPGSGPIEEIAAFHCIARPGAVTNRFTLTTTPNVADGFGVVLTAYQFAGDGEVHGVPVTAMTHSHLAAGGRPPATEATAAMGTRHLIALTGRWLAIGAGLAVASYAGYAATTWYRYGHPEPRVIGEERDTLVDRFMPAYDVAERHHVRVSAPADVTFRASTEMSLQQSAIVRGIFKAREWIGGSRAAREAELPAFLNQMRAIGWGTLAEVPGREIVMGAVTQPWLADVVFRPLRPDEFIAFHQPGYVKIVWTLRADPDGVAASIFRTETRVVTTDPAARAKFRRYWAFASPGIIVIRWASLGVVKSEAERRVRTAAVSVTTAR
jgi:hypothetical protein